MPNIKALHLPVAEKKNFEDGLLCPMFQLVTPGVGVGSTILMPGASHMNKLGRGPLEDATYQISSSTLIVWDKKIVKNFLLYLYVKSETPQHRTNFHSRAIIFKYFGRGPLDDATCQL